ncbi:isoprenyl transferase [Candidatus Hepatincola sp. Av]
MNHLAIIMDGNRRWAKKQDLSIFEGYEQGIKALQRAIEAALDCNIKYLSCYGFSSENWSRPKEEIQVLKQLIIEYLNTQQHILIDNEVRLLVIGEYEEFGKDIVTKIQDLEKRTANFNKLVLTIALGYGSRNEIIQAINRIIQDSKANKIPNTINSEIFSNYLFTKDMPDPDCVVRTGKEYRLSNFLLWQLSYAELIFLDIMWPEFTKKTLEEIIATYNNRTRRHGN